MANPSVFSLLSVESIQSICVCMLVFVVAFLYFRRPKNIPPGPYGWPFIGNLPLVLLSSFRKEHVHDLMCKLAGKYGNVFSLNFGGKTRVIVLNDLKSIKEAFQQPEISHRVPSQVLEQVTDGRGLLVSSWDVWKHQRRLCLSVFRSLGVGKSSFDDQIAIEAWHLCDAISKSNGQPFDPRPLLTNATSNMICSIVFGKRFDYNDKDFHYLLAILDERIKCIGSGALQTQVPLLRMLRRKNTDALLECVMKNFNYFAKVVKEHKLILEESGECNDLIDLYLKEIEQINSDPTMTSIVNEAHLVSLSDNLFLAGTETSSNTLAWCLLHMIAQPDLQERIREEIDAVCGQDRLPRYSDRDNMPFTEAVIHEVQRLHTIGPLGIPHYANTNTTIQGYAIPEGSIVLSNLWAVHHDSDVWDEPNEFKPSRFLDQNGVVSVKEEWIPFSSGRRVCPGERLAKMEIFIFLTHILARFSLKQKDIPVDIPTSLSFKGRAGATYGPLPYEVSAGSLT